MNKIQIDRQWAMPSKNTFDIKPIKELLEKETDKNMLWIDPFAGTNKIASITNDLNTEFDTNYHLDALDFFKTFKDESVDGVLYDPPYSPRQISEWYQTVNESAKNTTASFWSNHKKEISRIVKKGGKVITFSWNSGGIGEKYGFTIKNILLVPHGGWHNDTICTVEIKTHNHDTKEAETMKIKHWAGYGTVIAKKISEQNSEGIKILKIEVRGNHEYGLYKDDKSTLTDWLVKKFDKTISDYRKIINVNISENHDSTTNEDVCTYIFTYQTD